MNYTKGHIFATLPYTKRGELTVLKGDPKGKNFLYTNGSNVIIRDIENPEICDVYTQHARQTTVAVYAPSGFYIASGDVSGRIRIWDTTQQEHILKYEWQPLSGPIKDIAWSPDSKRIAVAGHGREKFAHVFLWDSGSSVGNLIGHRKGVNAVDYRPTRPYRICTASEDQEVGFFEGPPFKLHHLNKSHTNFVNCVRYSPDGELFASGGADGQIFLYNGKTGEETVIVGGGKAHKGGIYGLSWSGDSKFLLSASADRTAKIWDIEANTASVEFTFGSQIEDQQLGCLWQKDHLLTVSGSGDINYLDRSNPSKPRQVLQGHYKNIMAMTSSTDGSHLYSASYDGRICEGRWKVATGQAERFKGQGHSNQVSDMALSGSTLATCSMDDTVRLTSVESMEYDANSVGLESMPKGIASGKDGLVVVACIQHISVLRNGKPVFSLPVNWEPTCVSVHPGQTEVAVGGKSGDVHIFTLDNDTLVEKMKLPGIAGEVSDVLYSPDGANLAIAVSTKVKVCDSSNYEVSYELSSHTARVMCLAWSPDSRHIASGGMDTNVTVWTPEKGKIPIKGAHPQGVVTGVTWVDNNTVASCGHDCCIRFWKVTYE